MEEIKRITIYLGLEEYPLEFITLAPMSPDEADLITEMGEGFFKDELFDIDVPLLVDVKIVNQLFLLVIREAGF